MGKFHILIKVRTLLAIVYLMFVLVRCGSNSEGDRNQYLESQTRYKDSTGTPTSEAETDSFRRSEEISKKLKFKIPAGIDESRFVVAFYDTLCKCPIAIFYDDAKRRKATRITFYPDGRTFRKKLIPQSPSSFGERFEDWPEDKPHYEIYPAIVQYVHTNGSVWATYEVLQAE